MKDISETVRVKCAVCRNVDLCLECFAVGVEIWPHKRTHAYKVVENLSFPLLSPDWGADEELLLLDAVSTLGSVTGRTSAGTLGTARPSSAAPTITKSTSIPRATAAGSVAGPARQAGEGLRPLGRSRSASPGRASHANDCEEVERGGPVDVRRGGYAGEPADK